MDLGVKMNGVQAIDDGAEDCSIAVGESCWGQYSETYFGVKVDVDAIVAGGVEDDKEDAVGEDGVVDGDVSTSLR